MAGSLSAQLVLMYPSDQQGGKMIKFAFLTRPAPSSLRAHPGGRAGVIRQLIQDPVDDAYTRSGR
jgi:hypothetical protein